MYCEGVSEVPRQQFIDAVDRMVSDVREYVSALEPVARVPFLALDP